MLTKFRLFEIDISITRKKITAWLKCNRESQVVMITMVTDTAFKIDGDRMECPQCTDTPLTLEHVLLECPEYEEERQDAFVYSGSELSTKSFQNNTLVPTFCLAAARKIRSNLNTAREVFLQKLEDAQRAAAQNMIN